MSTIGTRVEAVKAHAAEPANYERGWDVIVETFTDEEIAEEVKGCRTDAGAIRRIGAFVRARHAYAEDVRATAW